MEKITTKPTSLVTEQASDIAIRETATTLLIFRPITIDNPNNRNASIKGDILYQRK